MATHATTTDEYKDYARPNVTLKESLKISNYPHNYEKKINTRTGIEIFIRPIKPDDKSILLDLFDSLSTETRYFRFFSLMKKVPDDMLIRFTQIDYMRDMTLVALNPTDQEGKILAVANFISKPNQSDAEFAVIVHDEWQGRGVGRALLENLILIARDKKIAGMSGYVLEENTYMLSLGRKMGFSLSRVPEEHLYILKIDLSSVEIINNKSGSF